MTKMTKPGNTCVWLFSQNLWVNMLSKDPIKKNFSFPGEVSFFLGKRPEISKIQYENLLKFPGPKVEKNDHWITDRSPFIMVKIKYFFSYIHLFFFFFHLIYRKCLTLKISQACIFKKLSPFMFVR